MMLRNFGTIARRESAKISGVGWLIGGSWCNSDHVLYLRNEASRIKYSETVNYAKI